MNAATTMTAATLRTPLTTSDGASTVHVSAEHEFEAAHGLPEPLPDGERIVWQGSPDLRALARRCFHLPALTVYFSLILAARAATVLGTGGSALDAVSAVAALSPVALAALLLVFTLAWLTARTAVYTITDRRVVMRIGIVLTVTFNLPYSRIAAAAVSAKPGEAGDIALLLEGQDHIAYLHLWPHARPWQVRKPQPALRCIADAHTVGGLLSDAWRTARAAAARSPSEATNTTTSSVAPSGRLAPAGAFARAARRIDRHHRARTCLTSPAAGP